MENIVSLRCLVCEKCAQYPDATGKPRQFCAVHAAEVGAHVLSSSNFSRAASDCFDMLEEEVGYRFTLRHRFDASAGTWSGKEFARLDLFTAEGLSVFYIWEHEFVEWRKRASWQNLG